MGTRLEIEVEISPLGKISSLTERDYFRVVLPLVHVVAFANDSAVSDYHCTDKRIRAHSAGASPSQLKRAFHESVIGVAWHSYQLPVTGYQLPVAGYQLPVAGYQFPVSSYQSVTARRGRQPPKPLTGNRKPATGNR